MMMNFTSVPGQVLKRKKGIFLWHVGIDVGGGNVVDATPGRGVAVRSIDDFADGKEVFDGGYPGNLSPSMVINNALAMVGEGYSFIGDNCEHLVSRVHGLKKASPQLQTWVAFGAVALVCVVALRSRRA